MSLRRRVLPLFAMVLVFGLVVPAVHAQGKVRGDSVPLGLPAPANFTAVPAKGGVQLHWDVVRNATGYWLYRGPSASSPDTLIGNLPRGDANSFFDKGHTLAGMYRVAAVSGAGTLGARASVAYVPPVPKFDAPVSKRP